MSGSIHEVIVGYDGSTGSRCALDWAGDEAARRGSGLHVVCAADPGVLPPPFATHLDPDQSERLTAAAALVLHVGLAHAGRRHPDLEITGEVVIGPPTEMLVKAAVGAELLVVGSSGNGALPRVLLGSVARAVAGSAACPVAVTRGNAYLPRWKPIVVAYDGTPASAAALAYGIDEAQRANARLVIVTAWQTDFAEPWTKAFWAQSHPGEQAAKVAREAAESVSAEALLIATTSARSLQVNVHAEHGDPASVLIEAARTAGQLVTGIGPDRNTSGLGAVNHALVIAASCPVVLVPATYSVTCH